MTRHLDTLECSVMFDRAEAAPQLQALASETDGWVKDGYQLTRQHRRPRDELFTPMRVEGSPPARALGDTRITRGVFLKNNEAREVIDSWKARGTAHRSMGQRWIGTTTFIAKS